MTAPVPPISLDAQLRQPAKGNGYQLLHSFKGAKDGNLPGSDLLVVGGNLYGTTVLGGYVGSSWCTKYSSGCGTVFEVTPSGAERVIHIFTASPGDGAFPYGGLIEVKGRLYGTTSSGGEKFSYYNQGTIYEMSLTGQDKILYNFAGGDLWPYGELLSVGKTLYGTTSSGGAGSLQGCVYVGKCGTVFGVTLSGHERVLHDFQSAYPPRDGAFPHAGLTLLNGEMYGTTTQGGASQGGTVFAIDAAGKERVVYSFNGFSKRYGHFPRGALTAVNGELYGTTLYGGVYGSGTVFKVSPSGKTKLVYAFRGTPSDGQTPEGRLTFLNGSFYGTTSAGGSHKCFSSGTGCGTVFEVTPSGIERVLHNFKGGVDGATPIAGVTALNGSLYGTTSAGGTGKCAPSQYNAGGCGTIFRITP